MTGMGDRCDTLREAVERYADKLTSSEWQEPCTSEGTKGWARGWESGRRDAGSWLTAVLSSYPDPDTEPEPGVYRLVREAPTDQVLVEVKAERRRQTAKFGDQSNLPDGTGQTYDRTAATVARTATDVAADENRLTLRHILNEEVHEAYAETDPVKLRAELIQVAAVAVQWIEAIDKRESSVPDVAVDCLVGGCRHGDSSSANCECKGGAPVYPPSVPAGSEQLHDGCKDGWCYVATERAVACSDGCGRVKGHCGRHIPAGSDTTKSGMVDTMTDPYRGSATADEWAEQMERSKDAAAMGASRYRIGTPVSSPAPEDEREGDCDCGHPIWWHHETKGCTSNAHGGRLCWCQAQPEALQAAHDAALRARVAGEIAEKIEAKRTEALNASYGQPDNAWSRLHGAAMAYEDAASIARAAAEGGGQ